MRIERTILPVLLLAAAAALSCSPSAPDDVRVPPHNVLLIIADDIGVDSLALYPEANHAADWPETPHIASLAAEGLVFDSAWATPYCSSTRASILTGRYGERTGVTEVVRTLDPNSLSIDEVTIPRVIDRLGPDGPATGAFGKWHLGNRWNGAWNHPNIAGFDHYAGAPSNLKATNSFYRWTRVVNGKKRETRRYATTVNVDDTLAWIGEQRRPWFAWLAFNAAHWPWQVPPHELLPESDEPRPPAGEHCGAPCRRWMIEAMDTEIGRLLAGLGKQRSRTTIIFVGDNGTPAGVRPRGSPYPARPGMQHMKGTLYEGGLHVPLVVTGPAVREPGARSPALVHSTDLFATIIELVSGASLADLLPELEVDARSLLPLLTGKGTTVREFAYASLAGKSYAIRDHRFKLMRSEEGDRLFDLGDPRDRFLEVSNLMDSPRSELVEARYRALSSELGRLLASFEQSGPIPLADGAGAGRP